ncbi:hypothetical protein [Massilia soli]|uniref:DUF4233 domain-containing protein n=1 Tax=Massilia soli TaxID=2792854 RepID=A0ABS7STN4_9BURK|nr:hypothetical protein [Massilia soli]MBZ2209282.1 hypothetical protein [Massilia soli]
MRAFAVVAITFIVSMTILVTSYQAFLGRASLISGRFSLAGMGIALGFVAGWCSWVQRHPAAFVGTNFVVGCLILLPMVLTSYGFALILFPFVLVWVGTNFLGFILTQKFRAANRTGVPPVSE